MLCAGFVTVKAQLDFESLEAVGQTFYILNISASDRSFPESDRRVVYTTLTIEIQDGDDLEPAFEYETCTRFNNICYNPRYTTTIQSGVLVSALFLLEVLVLDCLPVGGVDVGLSSCWRCWCWTVFLLEVLVLVLDCLPVGGVGVGLA